MRHRFQAIVLFLTGAAIGVGVVCAGGCAHVKPFAQCEETAVGRDVEAAVVAALADLTQWRARLNELVAQFGKDSIDCAVLAFLHQPAAKPGDVRVDHAHAWLGAR
ncbi:MAG TPA: hypothetical protein VFJ24_09395 [Gaiellales bacterium]|nr:hypothetical protein [Gaiellales bacterium]